MEPKDKTERLTLDRRDMLKTVGAAAAGMHPVDNGEFPPAWCGDDKMNCDDQTTQRDETH